MTTSNSDSAKSSTKSSSSKTTPRKRSGSSGQKKEKTDITVVGSNQAVEGYVFFYSGPLSECKSCKVKNICFGLRPGRFYRVKSVRDTKHECKVFDSKVQVVVVEPTPAETIIEGKKAVEGTVITLGETKCMDLSCPHYKICRPLQGGLKRGAKLKIIEVKEEVKCSKSKGRTRVMVLPAD
ncbi:MAG: UPF0179 family protein [Thermoplasmata archaeon]|nr:UPF0179 family protein [Thermoplasmata archaeon]